MLTGLLHMSGAYVGEIIDANDDNPKGFWEHKGIRDLNKKILSFLGVPWDVPVPLPEGWMQTLSSMEKERDAIISEFLDQPLWVIKEPRLCHLFAWWREGFISRGADISVVIPIRHPLSVAKSLSSRNETPLVRALISWCHHVLAVEAGSRSLPRMVLDYDSLLDSPGNNLEQIKKGFNLNLNLPSDSLIDTFVDRSLRHHFNKESDKVLASEIEKLCCNFYDNINEISILKEGDAGEKLFNVSEQARRQLYNYQMQYLHIDEDFSTLLNKNNQCEVRLAERDAQLNQCETQLAECDAQLNMVLNSKSWKITAPLRKARHWLGDTRAKSMIRGLITNKEKWQHLRAKASLQKVWRFYKKNGLWRTLQRIAGTIQPSSSIGITPPIAYESASPSDINNPAIKVIAFYLPQFHPIPENDEWWGEGFTEWTNVTTAYPLFSGHDQPKQPGVLGYYDLRLKETMHRQIAMAKQFGIHGFCFHYYWFDGKRLLERPIEQLLADPALDIPFCLSWANENWTRRWDGEDQQILINQRHTPEDDIAVMRDLLRYFKDARYIRIDGRPVFMVYRASLLPDMQATLRRWKDVCTQEKEALPFFVMVQSFENYDPRPMGFDAAVQFPPHYADRRKPLETASVSNLNNGFSGNLYSYDGLARRMLESLSSPFPTFPCVVPSWDNTARRKQAATAFIGSTPEKYAKWLHAASKQTIEKLHPEQRFVFINAWNEWAEGAYLEPDRKYGYAYLNATSRVLASLSDAGQVCNDSRHRLRILFVGHDAALAGAQILLLHAMRWLKRHASVEMYLLLLGDGVLRDAFEECCPVFLCTDALPAQEELNQFCPSPDIIYGNTAVAARCYDNLAYLKVPILTHVHELENSLKKFATPEILEQMKRHSSFYIAASEPVKKNLITNHKISPEKIEIVDAFIEPSRLAGDHDDKQILRRQLGLPAEGKLIMGCGTLDWRKGPDLFVEVAWQVLSDASLGPVYFCWVGAGSDTRISSPKQLAKKYEIEDKVFFVGERLNVRDFFRAADLFLLTSREDPFPLVALEACEHSLPVICFADSGGMPDFIKTGPGYVVPFENTEKMARQVLSLLHNESERIQVGKKARSCLMETHTTNIAVPHLLRICRFLAQKSHPVSVIVPNYNYARYLPARMESIFSQTFRDMEVIFLDDASTDDSLDVVEQWQRRASFQIIKNNKNSGNVSLQWKTGLEAARGSFVWIAEADDSCSSDFLATMLKKMQDPEIILAYTIPSVIDDSGNYTYLDYRQKYLKNANSTRWQKNYVTSGEEEISEALGIVNCVPNVSAALFRKPKDNSAVDAASQFRYAGDWMFYLRLANAGKVAYVQGNFAKHRRHEKSVIASDTKKKTTLANEAKMIHKWVINNNNISDETKIKMNNFVESIQ